MGGLRARTILLEGKFAILFAATILAARRLIDLDSDKPNMAKGYFVHRAIDDAVFILETDRCAVALPVEASSPLRGLGYFLRLDWSFWMAAHASLTEFPSSRVESLKTASPSRLNTTTLFLFLFGMWNRKRRSC